MPNDSKKVFHEIDFDNKPVAVLVNSAGMLGSYLAEFLLNQGCAVLAFVSCNDFGVGDLLNLRQNNSLKVFDKKHLDEVLSSTQRVDYLFYLSEENSVLSKKTIDLFLDLSQDQQTKFCFILDKTLENTSQEINLVGKYFSTEPIDSRIVEVKFVYGPRMDFARQDVLTKIIYAALSKKTVQVSVSDSEVVNPTFVADAVYAIGKAIFSSQTSGKVFLAVSPEEFSLVKLVEAVKKSLGDLEVNFRSIKGQLSDLLLPDGFTRGDLRWSAKTDLETGLLQTAKYFKSKVFLPDQNQERAHKQDVLTKDKKNSKKYSGLIKRIKQIFKKKSLRSKEKKQKKGFYFVLSFVLGVLVFSLLSFGLSLFSLTRVIKAFDLLKEGKFEKSVQIANNNEKVLLVFEKVFFKLDSLFSPEKDDSFLDTIKNSFSVSTMATSVLKESGNILVDASNLSEKMFSENEEVLSNTELERMSRSVDRIYLALSKMEMTLKTNPKILVFLRRNGLDFDDGLFFEKLKQGKDLLLQAKEGIDLIPTLTGQYSKKTYLVLLQNNMELRPTGGFIGSYALLTFDKGRLSDFEVQDVYKADGQLKGHVEPPEELKRYLGEAGWYLRDSNFDPDFPTSANRAAWFLEKETGRKVDGVLALNLFVIKKMLEEIGPVKLLDYEETIDADNVFDRAEYHAEVNFFPGSEQKKNFLSSLSNALFQEIKALDDKKTISLAKGIFDSFSSKDLMFYSSDKQINDYFYSLGLNGAVKQFECIANGGDCIADFLMIVEANLGVNKANYFVQRKVTHQVNLSDSGVLEEQLKIVYKNNSQTEVFPAGAYKNYLRILTPVGSKIEKVLIDGEELESRFIFETEVADKNSFGFLVEVPIMSETTVELTYSLDQKVNLEKGSANYMLLVQKQSGIEDKAFDFVFNSDSLLGVKDTNPKSSLISGLALFSTELKGDRVFEVSLE